MSASFLNAAAVSAWAAQTLVATTLLIVLVLVARGSVRRVFGAGAAYALWAIPAARVVLPSIDLLPAPSMIAAGPIGMAGSSGVAGAAATPWLFWAWAIGAAAFAGWHIVGYRRFVARAVAASTTMREDGTMILACDIVNGPAAIGLFDPRILVPRDFQVRFDAAERRLALHHEAVHHARGDLWANAAALAMLSLHWFNPLARIAYRAFREDQEYACDAAVIARAGGEDRAAYASAMVKSAAGADWGAHWAARAVPLMTCPMTRPMTRAANLKRRLKMVKTHRRSVGRFIGGAMAGLALALGGLTLTATGVTAAQPTGRQLAGRTGEIVVTQLRGPGASASASAKVEALCGEEARRSLGEILSAQKGTPVKVRMIDCSGTSDAPAVRLTRLERARTSVAASTTLSDEMRGKALAAIDAEIGALKSAR